MTNSSTYDNEAVLIQQLIIGDEKAFEYIFDSYYVHLCHYARKLLCDQDLSEDIVHNTLCNLWTKKHKIKITTSIKPYLFRSVYNAAMTHLRHRKTEEKYAKEKYYQFIQNEMMLTPDKEIEIINNELGKKIYEAIDSLPEKCQKVFRLSKISGLKNQEIAEELGVSINTVQTQMKIALKKLRAKLGDQRFLLLMLCLGKNQFNS
ncbi:RNA polymerase sigma-70 factor [Marinifilum sp.]|uniref:RNA polymerase sigma-70 factor n=1 Tax=Marinifilum sp. TaxID=2033137 RepID=UPI003BACB8A4